MGYFANEIVDGRGKRCDELGKFESDVFFKQGKQRYIFPLVKRKDTGIIWTMKAM